MGRAREASASGVNDIPLCDFCHEDAVMTYNGVYYCERHAIRDESRSD